MIPFPSSRSQLSGSEGRFLLSAELLGAGKRRINKDRVSCYGIRILTFTKTEGSIIEDFETRSVSKGTIPLFY